jgi:prepilin-type N-terminal cleavage/methylation domain-containing protein
LSDTGRGLAGYTLFELLVVLAIISAASAIALPAVSSGFGSLNARSAALRVSSAMIDAREKAMRTRSVHYAEASGKALIIRTAEGRVVKELPFSSSLTLDSGRAISFSPGGFSSGGNIKVLSEKAGYSVVVTASGRPRIEAIK